MQQCMTQEKLAMVRAKVKTKPYLTSYERIWQDYKEVRRCDRVTREGFSRYGVTDEVDSVMKVMSEMGGLSDKQLQLLKSELEKISSNSSSRVENVSEHSLGAIELVMGISRYLPHIIHPFELMRFVRILKYHDVPEKETGDTLDDGTRNEERKNTEEYSIMENFTTDWPKMEREDLLYDYKLFQNPYDEGLEPRDRRFAQIAYACDKIDAVLRALIYESYGHNGIYVVKNTTVSNKEYFEVTGTDNMVDCWAYQFVNKVLSRNVYNSMFLRILKAAVLDVRGEWFAWTKDS